MTAPPGWVDPNAPSTTNVNPNARTILGIAAAALTAVVVATLVTVVVMTRGVDSSSGPQADDVVLTAANAAVADPFGQSVVLDRTPPSPEAAQHITESVAGIPYFPDRGVRLASGTQRGMYGTFNRPHGPCDGATAATALLNDATRGTTWATALDLQRNEIPYYLNTLTPVTLTVDTWVTSYGYVDGAARPYQTVLQAGNAVMIDPAGVPRLHCEGLSPLAPPANRNLSDLRQMGRPWPEFDGRKVVAIAYTAGTAAQPTAEFTLLDLASGQTVNRNAGGTINLGPGATRLPNPVAMNAAP
ncbi:DUF6777 domain-containing protein [Mycobacterium sp. 141]|uniref:DUF6777 domain-containing protein n=1 Tax=Mycobacterium sp. 141 TaxID=1120797 RepID=UPI00035CAA5E|nr:DUF6777 domain-containing protein [Mycobacterium sp. 141]